MIEIIRRCRICGNPTQKKHNAFYCDKCVVILRRKGAKRYKITNDVWVWTTGVIKRATYKGKDVNPIYELYDVVD